MLVTLECEPSVDEHVGVLCVSPLDCKPFEAEDKLPITTAMAKVTLTIYCYSMPGSMPRILHALLYLLLLVTLKG